MVKGSVGASQQAPPSRSTGRLGSSGSLLSTCKVAPGADAMSKSKATCTGKEPPGGRVGSASTGVSTEKPAPGSDQVMASTTRSASPWLVMVKTRTSRSVSAESLKSMRCADSAMSGTWAVVQPSSSVDAGASVGAA